MEKTEPVIVNIPCPSREEAEKLCRELIEKELCGTAKLIPAYLMYPKDGKALGEEITLMSLKTTQVNLEAIHSFILENHSWGTPCIEVTPMVVDIC